MPPLSRLTGIVDDCSSTHITLTGGRRFAFPFPSGGQRQPIPTGTLVELILTHRGVREYATFGVVTQTKGSTDDILTTPSSGERGLAGLGHPAYYD